MNKLSRTLFAAALLGTGTAFAQTSDAFCFGNCLLQQSAQTAPAATLGLCRHRVVREALAVERELQPVRQIVDIVQNPTGFVLKQVNAHVIHIPAWVGYAMNPRGAIRAKVMDSVRHEMKKAAGLDKGCVPGEGAAPEEDEHTWLRPRPDEA